MGMCKRVNAKELAEMVFEILKHPYDNTIEFGEVVEYGCENDEKVPSNLVTGWYFIKRISDVSYDSNILLIDYSGGGKPYAIPLDHEKDFTSDDKEIVVSSITTYLRYYLEETFVWVETEEIENETV